MREWDVTVVGGGPSGAMAAIASARAGKRTLLVERYGFCGGSLTSAGVGPMMTFHAGGRQVVRGIPQELVDRMTRLGGCRGHVKDATGYASSVTPFDAEAMKLALDQMLAESGCETLYHACLAECGVSGRRIERAVFLSGSRSIPVRSRIWIDATGNGELFAMAGVSCELGRTQDHLCQPMTTNVKIGHVNLTRVRQDIAESPSQFRLDSLDDVRESELLSVAGYTDILRRAIADGRLSFEREVVLFFETPHPGEVILNMTRMTGYNPTDPWQISEAERIGRRQAWEAFTFLKASIPAFSDAQLLQTGVHIGIRESRRLNGQYRLTADDLLRGTCFEDAIAVGGYPIDIHNPKGNDTFTTRLPEGASYQIPYRCLLTDEAENLIVAGRCISATHEACAAIRVSPIVMAIGQAAGTAAALSVQTNTIPARADVPALQRMLLEGGAVLK